MRTGSNEDVMATPDSEGGIVIIVVVVVVFVVVAEGEGVEETKG